jgi:VCBS repeat-containing protein
VTINGTNDAAVLTDAVVALEETNAPLTATGALTISDVDNAATFVAQTDTAGVNGSFSIDETGAWTYTANQAFDSLNVGESVSDTFAVLAADGTATSVQVTINGTNDAAVVSADVVALDQTSDPLTTSGALTITDVDNPVTFIAQTDVAGTNGTFSIDEAGAWTYTANQAFASLTVGESVTDSFEVSAADGTTSSVQVTINGVNDAAVLSSAVVALDQTSEPLTTSGTLTISDVDSPVTFVAQDAVAGVNGTFSIDEAGAWSYVANQAFASLSVGESLTDSFAVLSADGTETSVQVTINGTNDAPVITSSALDAEGAVTEAGNTDPGVATVSGTLTSSDADAVNTAAWSINGDGNGTYGSLAISPEGIWTYTLDNSRDATQALAEGQTEQDVFTARVVDDQGAFVDQIITVSVAGANDELVLSASLTSHTYDLNDAVGVTTPTVDGLLTAVGVGTETFGVAGGFLDSGFELKDTPYGTVFVNTSTGEYRFDVNEAALADVTAGQNPSDLHFELTVTDSSSATDSEELVISFTGNDDLTVDSAAVVNGNGGNDLITDAYSGVSTINAGLGNDKVLGNGGNDKINGDEGNDYLFGGHGTDGINGGDGDDVIIGGSGYDFLSGGAGADTFRWANIVAGSEVALGVSGSNGESISDYSFADGDLIDLSLLNTTVDVTDLSFYHDDEQDSNFLAVNGTNLFEIVDATQIQVLIDGDHQTLPLTV